MIGTIEDDSPELKKHIPKLYQSPKFTTEEINPVSIWVITAIQLFFMVFLIYSVDGNLFCSNVSKEAVYREICGLSTPYEWILLLALKLLFGFLLIWSFTQRQKRVQEYWDLVKDFKDRRDTSGYSGYFAISDVEIRKQRLADNRSYLSYFSLTFMLTILILSDILHDVDIIMPTLARWIIVSVFIVTGIAIGAVARFLQLKNPWLEVPPLLGWDGGVMRIAQMLFIAEGAVAAALIT